MAQAMGSGVPTGFNLDSRHPLTTTLKAQTDETRALATGLIESLLGFLFG